MDPKYARAFVNAARKVCLSTLSLETKIHTPQLIESHAPRHYITGVLQLFGDKNCTVSIGFDRMVAVRATECLLGYRDSKVSAQVVDAVGELTNQIVGLARQNMQPLTLEVSLPIVICGVSRLIPFPAHSQRISIPMTSLWGNLAIDFGFENSPVNEAAVTHDILKGEQANPNVPVVPTAPVEPAATTAEVTSAGDKTVAEVTSAGDKTVAEVTSAGDKTLAEVTSAGDITVAEESAAATTAQAVA